jgi:hypothetical protein
MNTSKLTLLILGMLFSSIIFSQEIVKQDSFFVDRGIDGTTEFESETRSIIQEHNEDGRPLVIVSHVYQNEEWIPFRRRELEYDGQRIVSVLIQFWNPVAGEFFDNKKRIFNYNDTDDLESRIILRASEPGMPLQNSRQWLYEYDDEGRLLIQTYQKWEKQTWVDARRKVFNYNDDGLLEQKGLQYWSGGEWQNFHRRQLNYDSQSNWITQALGQKWSIQEQAWVNTRRKNYEYQGSFLNSEQVQIWDSLSGAWENDHRQMFTAGPQGQFQGRWRQVWSQGAWLNQFLGGQTFSGQDLVVNFQKWNAVAESWEQGFRHLLSYDADANLIMSKGWQYWNPDTDDWLNSIYTLRYTYFWSDLMTSLSDTETPQSCRIANPYSRGLPLICALPESGDQYVLELFDLMGRKVYAASFSAAEQPAINHDLPAGTYLVRISQNEAVFHLQKLAIF